VRLPNVPIAYNRLTETERNRTLELADRQNRKVGQDVEIGGERLVLTSPNGTRFSVTVANDGTLSATSI
jgi:phosphosulfolactate phosphohydrolase-like enzyme